MKIKSSEWPRALLAFSYFFLVITSYYIIKPVRDSLFIGSHGAADLPKAKLLTFLVLSVLVFVMLRLVNVLRKNIYLSSCVAFSVIVLLVFAWFSRAPHFWVAYAFYVWVSIYSVLNVSLFWTSASDIFNVQEAKRLFGFVGSGGILGGIVGSYLTSRIATTVGTHGLLLTAAFLLSFCVLIINWLWSLERDPDHLQPAEQDLSKQLELLSFGRAIGETVKIIFEILRNRYLFIVLSLFVFGKMASTIVDYQFKNLVHVLPQDQLTIFFADYNMQVNIASFAIQFFLTSLVLRKMGVIAALFLLPIGIGTGSLAILMHPELWVGRVVSIYDKGMSYSLNQTTREVLYLPVDRETRYRVKPVIDLIGFRMADALGNLLILILTRQLHLDIRQLSIASLSIAVVWTFVVWVMKNDYRARLRSYLARGPLIEKGNLLSHSFVLLFNSLLEGIGKLHRKEQLFLLRVFNLCNHPEGVEKLHERLKQTPGASGANIAEALERERSSRSFEDELQELLENGLVEQAGMKVSYVMQFRNRSADRLCKIMQKSHYASVRLSGVLTQASFSETPVNVDEEIDRYQKDEVREKKEEEKVILDAVRPHAPSEEAAEKFMRLVCAQTRENLSANMSWLKEGGWVIPAVIDCVNEQRLAMQYRYGLPLMLSAVTSLQSIQALQKLLEHRNSTVRLSALKALNKLRVNASDIRFDEPLIEYELYQTADRWRTAFRTMTVYRFYSERKRIAISGEDYFLGALERRLNDLQERIFRLLGLLCDCEEAFQIYNALQQTDAQLRANAVELLEHILPPRLRPMLMDILDPDFSHEHTQEDLTAGEAESHIQSMLSGVSRWNGLSALTLIVRFDLEGFDEEIRALTEAKDPMIRYVAVCVANQLSIIHAHS